MERSHAVFLSLQDRPPRPSRRRSGRFCVSGILTAFMWRIAPFSAPVSAPHVRAVARAESFAFTAPRRIIFRLFLHRKRHMHPARTCARFPKSWLGLQKKG